MEVYCLNINSEQVHERLKKRKKSLVFHKNGAKQKKRFCNWEEKNYNILVIEFRKTLMGSVYSEYGYVIDRVCAIVM